MEKNNIYYFEGFVLGEFYVSHSHAFGKI